MRKFCIAFLLVFNSPIFAQTVDYHSSINYFLDNTEFARSSATIDQTMTGIHYQGYAVFSKDTINTLNAGLNLLALPGEKLLSTPSIDPVIFFKHQKENNLWIAGSFPKQKILANYSDFLFQDSVFNFRPMMHGAFWKKVSERNFFSLWLDWTGYQSATTNESFFIGSSGSYFLQNFFVDYQSYMFHFANTNPRTPNFYVCDNLLAQANVGYRRSWGAIEDFVVSTGVLTGVERERDQFSLAHAPLGNVSRLLIEHKYIGLDTKVYLGDNRMLLYPKYSNRLYWGNPFLRRGNYSISKLYFKFIDQPDIQARFSFVFHVSEGQLMHEQMFTVNASIDHFLKKRKP